MRNCYRTGETGHVFRVTQRDLDQFTRRHAVSSTDITVAEHGLLSPRAGIFDIILFQSKELKNCIVKVNFLRRRKMADGLQDGRT